MACFLVPAAEAAVVTAVEKHEAKKEAELIQSGEAKKIPVIPVSRKLKWLTNLLWGGSALLAFEHIWHGEVVLWFPFLTAMSNPAEAAAMFHEMATVGVCMALFVTGVWIGICLAADAIVKRPQMEADKTIA